MKLGKEEYKLIGVFFFVFLIICLLFLWALNREYREIKPFNETEIREAVYKLQGCYNEASSLELLPHQLNIYKQGCLDELS